MRRPARRCALVLALAALPLTGCGSTDGPSPQSPETGSSGSQSPAATGPVALRRSGGIAGAQDSVTVQPDGSWRRTAKAGGPGTGTLSADQRTRLARMAADPALRAEATRTVREIECADGFDYQLTAGSTTVAWRDCGSATTPPAVASSIATFLLRSTS